MQALHSNLEDLALQEVTEALDQDLLEGQPVPDLASEGISLLEEAAEAHLEAVSDADNEGEVESDFVEAEADAEAETEVEEPQVNADMDMATHALVEAGVDAHASVQAEADLEVDMEAAAAVDADLEAEMRADAAEERKFDTEDDALARFFFWDDADEQAETPAAPATNATANTTTQPAYNASQYLDPGKTAATATAQKDQATSNVTQPGQGKGNKLRRFASVNETGSEWDNRRRYSRLDADLDAVDELGLDPKLDKADDQLKRLLSMPDLDLYESEEDKGLYFGPSKKDRAKRARMIRKAIEDSKKQAEKMAKLDEEAKKRAKKPLSDVVPLNATAANATKPAPAPAAAAAAAAPAASAK